MKNSRDRAHRRSDGWRVCAGLCLAATLGPVAAQNLAQNPRFDGSVAPWATVFSAAPDPVGAGTVAYNGTQDVDGNAPGSGSVQLDVPSVAAAGTARAEIAARECLPVPAGQQPVTEARYSARLRVPVAGNAADSLLNASIEVQFYSDAACATVREGGSVGEALSEAALLAAAAEKAGYKRFWVAEHHAMEGIAGGATAVTLAHIGHATSTIRIGADGIMLPNHNPFVIAEQFGTGEVALLLKGSRARDQRKRADSRIAQARREEAHVAQMPEEPPYQPDPPPRTRPLNLGETIDERVLGERERRRTRLGAPPRRVTEHAGTPPSSLLGEGEYTHAPADRRIDLSDTPSMAALGRSYRPGSGQPSGIEPTLGERLARPFRRAAGGLSAATHRRRLRRPPPSAMSQPGRRPGLSYRRQGPPFPWAVLVITVLVVAAAVLYGLNLSREVAQRRANDTLDRAAAAVAALDRADETSAPPLLEAAEVALAEVRKTGTITSTLENRQRYEDMQREYERAQATIQKLTYFDDLTTLASHPQAGGLFSSVVVPPPPQGITSTASFESIYLLDRNVGVLYRLPRAGGAPVPMLRPEDTVGPFVVGKVKDIAWREDNIIAVAQTGGNGPFIFYYRTGDQWGYNALAGSETWGKAGEHFRAVNYGGNLYVWDAGIAPEQAGQIQKYLSGNYGQFPDPWIKDSAGQKVENAVDLAIDGNVYLLKPDGHILVFEAGAFKREIVPQGINPALSTIAGFFVTGDPESGSIFLVDFSQRIVEIDKQTGALIQQASFLGDLPTHLDQLTSLYVDTSAVRPVLYLVNGGQLLRGSLPDRPRPFRPVSDTPGATSTEPAPTSAP